MPNDTIEITINDTAITEAPTKKAPFVRGAGKTGRKNATRFSAAEGLQDIVNKIRTSTRTLTTVRPRTEAEIAEVTRAYALLLATLTATVNVPVLDSEGAQRANKAGAPMVRKAGLVARLVSAEEALTVAQGERAIGRNAASAVATMGTAQLVAALRAAGQNAAADAIEAQE